MRVIGRALLWSLVGLVATPVITFLLMLVLYAADPQCGSPGDSGGCAMGLVSVTIMSALPGAALFFVVALVRSARRSSPS